jgi:phosphoenolpyruvate-protein phosphotransferase
VAEDLRVSARRIESDTNTKLADIFGAHQAMLEDPSLREEIHNLISEELINASRAVAKVFRAWERRFRELPEDIHRRAADDVADLGRRLLREMAGVKTTALEKIPAGRVLVARRLLPSDTVALPRRTVAGIVLEFGGQGSHAALFAEAMGIPTVGQVPRVLEQIAPDTLLVVDGTRGEVMTDPAPSTQMRYTAEIVTANADVARVMHTAAQPARTRDGVRVNVMANVGCREDISAAAENGADGVGLYRLEQFYLACKWPPTAAQLLGELTEAFAPMKGKPVTIRLLDLGGDKPLPFLKLPSEDNPFLGQRGVRLLLEYPELLESQLNALLQFTAEHDVRILVPMVTVAQDMIRVRSLLASVALKRGGDGNLPPMGAMIETPAAALCVQDITPHADFLSIGTNDLTQYTMAACRENPLVNDYFTEDHPAVLRLVRFTAEDSGGVPVAVCGELARRAELIPTLLRLGIRHLSVAPRLVPGIKESVRQITTQAEVGRQGLQ